MFLIKKNWFLYVVETHALAKNNSKYPEIEVLCKTTIDEFFNCHETIRNYFYCFCSWQCLSSMCYWILILLPRHVNSHWIHCTHAQLINTNTHTQLRSRFYYLNKMFRMKKSTSPHFAYICCRNVRSHSTEIQKWRTKPIKFLPYTIPVETRKKQLLKWKWD